MNEIWNQLQTQMLLENQDSGMHKAVINGIEFLELSQEENSSTIRLGVSNSLSLGIAQRDFSSVIQEKLQTVLAHKNVCVKFESSQCKTEIPAQVAWNIDATSLEKSLESLRTPEVEFKPKWFLNTEFQLSEFINGEHSDFAYKCVKMLAASQTPSMRQLFIYGPSGMGKTHLLHALGWQFKLHSPHLNVKVFSADQLINDYHMYVAKKQMPEFRGQYRLKTDVLLIDDVQSFARTKGAQEELFNIFNYYEQMGKIIAFTSDKSPQELAGFEDRLLTRFQGGLSAEIKKPNFATRLEILEYKQLKFGFVFSREILTYIAANITNSVRSLEGALFKVGTYQKLQGQAITIDELQRLIPQIQNQDNLVTVDSILAEVAKLNGLKISDLKSVSRKKPIVLARNQAMYRLREELLLSYAEIGRIFCRDHSTVINSLSRKQI